MKIQSVEFVKSVVNVEEIPKGDLGEIAFAGRSNVGKSSLINCLLTRKKLVKTSSTPGKTRQLNYFKINDRYHFVDLPGYGYAKVSRAERGRWRKLIESYITESPNLRAVVSIIDCRIGPTDLDLQLLEWLNGLKTEVVLVATKADKVSKSALATSRKKWTERLGSLVTNEIILFSSVKGTGKRELQSRITQLLE